MTRGPARAPDLKNSHDLLLSVSSLLEIAPSLNIREAIRSQRIASGVITIAVILLRRHIVYLIQMGQFLSSAYQLALNCEKFEGKNSVTVNSVLIDMGNLNLKNRI